MHSPHVNDEVDDSAKRRFFQQLFFWVPFALGLIALGVGAVVTEWVPSAGARDVQAALFAASGLLNIAAGGGRMRSSLGSNFTGEEGGAGSRLTAGFVMVWGLMGLALAYVVVAGGDAPGYTQGGRPSGL